MVQNVAAVMAELEPPDFYLLSGLEQGMRFSKWVDRGKLPEFAGRNTDGEYPIDQILRAYSPLLSI